MNGIYSNITGELLHLVYRIDELIHNSKQRQDLVASDNFIQLSFLNLSSNQSFPAHAHLNRIANFEDYIAQESWIVLKGRIEVKFFDLDDAFISKTVLSSGDCSITLKGGHEYMAISENAAVYEYKNGPYLGREIDKRIISSNH
jgi:hypothetical protein